MSINMTDDVTKAITAGLTLCSIKETRKPRISQHCLKPDQGCHRDLLRTVTLSAFPRIPAHVFVA